jgi:hypothetical protein
MILYSCNHCREIMHEGAYLTLSPRSAIPMHFCSWKCLEIMAVNHGV